MRKTTRWAAVMAAGLALLAGGPEVRAQETMEPAYTGPRQVISVNPFGIVFEWFNAEYERRMSDSFTLGASASYVPWDGGSDHYVSGNVLYRFYPQGRALQGFFFGGRSGVYHVNEDADSEVAFGLGFEIGYTWLLGVSDNFQVSLGAGATRVFGGGIDGSAAIPTVRLLNVGLGF